MKSLRSTSFAIALAFLLLFSQHGAYLHALSHVGTVTAESAAQQEDVEHGAAHSLSHACTGCVAFSGLSAAPLPVTIGLAFLDAALATFRHTRLLFRLTTPWHALPRGPPTVL